MMKRWLQMTCLIFVSSSVIVKTGYAESRASLEVAIRDRLQSVLVQECKQVNSDISLGIPKNIPHACRTLDE